MDLPKPVGNNLQFGHPLSPPPFPPSLWNPVHFIETTKETKSRQPKIIPNAGSILIFWFIYLLLFIDKTNISGQNRFLVYFETFSQKLYNRYLSKKENFFTYYKYKATL